MDKITISDEEFLFCLKEARESDIQKGIEPILLTTGGFQKKLEEKGIVVAWASLLERLKRYHQEGKIEKIQTSHGTCWRVLDN